jgi:hypothetical protein
MFVTIVAGGECIRFSMPSSLESSFIEKRITLCLLSIIEQVSLFFLVLQTSSTYTSSSSSSSSGSPAASPSGTPSGSPGSSPSGSPGSSPSPPGSGGGQCPCTDQTPDTTYSCDQQKKYGKCDSSWMNVSTKDYPNAFCAKTCGRCPSTC